MEVIQQIAQKISECGGRTFYVGGYVRDRFLQTPSEDIDLEVFHLSLKELISILEQFGPLNLIGENFGVLKIANYPHIDFSLPRKEIKSGEKHTDFAITLEQDLPYIEAARRRDFTCNALMQDVLTGEVLDFFAGVDDLQHHVLRYVDEQTFIDDELRGLRAAQLAVRFNFTIDADTQELIRTLSYEFLSMERIQAELQKGLLSFHSRYFFALLFELNISPKLLPALAQLKTKKAEKYDNMLELLDQIDTFRYEPALALTLKLTAITFYLKESETLDTLQTFTSNKKIIQDVLALQHMIKETAYVTTGIAARHLKNSLVDVTRYWIFLSHIAVIDQTIIPKQFKNVEDYQRFFLISIKNNPGPAPLIQGRDLIALGFIPDKDFAQLLQYARVLEEEGLDKKSIEKALIRTKTDVKH